MHANIQYADVWSSFILFTLNIITETHLLIIVWVMVVSKFDLTFFLDIYPYIIFSFP